MTKGMCVKCLHCEDAPTAPGGAWQGWCVFNPPTPALIIGQGPPALVGGPPQQQTTVIAIRPPLTERDGCAVGFEAAPVVAEVPKLGESEPLPEQDPALDGRN